MIDINYYRNKENQAKDSLQSWVLAQKYNLDIFEKDGFPIRINNIQQTKQIIDTMQENRFNAYMHELNGFNAEDLSIFIQACIKHLEFQNNYFPAHKNFVPFDTLISAFAIFKKIKGINPKVEKILEIGPGAANFSFFLSNFSDLKEYTYTDSCESFYLLQNNINFFLFKDDFKQHVLKKEKNNCFRDKDNSIYSQGGLEEQVYIKNYKKYNFKCNAYPWWELGKLSKSTSKYDIVTSNANLLEFSEGALNDYLQIMNRKLKKEGMVFVQCLGNSVLRKVDYLLNKLKRNDFKILFFANGNVEYKSNNESKNISKTFLLPNMILIKKGHPLFDEANNSIQNNVQLSMDQRIDKVFFPDEENAKKIFSKDEITNLIIGKLKKEN